jgi:aminocarboxymuconate-semialdehyde decarboxylase
MRNRRDFLKNVAGAAAGVLLSGRALVEAGFPSLQIGAPPGKRREVFIGGRRVKTVDAHAHCFVPEVWDVVKDTPLAAAAKNNLTGNIALGNPQRLIDMDAQGIDYQAINVNAWGYSAERALARDLVKVQNEKISQWCAKYPDRFVGMATLALQHPDLAADQLDEAVRKLGLRGAAIGGSVEGEELSDRKFDPFWAKAEQLGVLLFMHPQPAPGTTQNPRLQGKGGLGNTIGNPLETTVFLSHLIFEGTLDRFPKLKICAAHAGGYLPSYSGRSDALCGRGSGADCKALRKKPSEYFKDQLLVDTMIFREDGLRHLIAEVGVGQMVYGTDYPFDWPVGIDFILNAPFLSNAEKEAILGGNLVRLLRIT